MSRRRRRRRRRAGDEASLICYLTNLIKLFFPDHRRPPDRRERRPNLPNSPASTQAAVIGNTRGAQLNQRQEGGGGGRKDQNNNNNNNHWLGPSFEMLNYGAGQFEESGELERALEMRQSVTLLDYLVVVVVGGGGGRRPSRTSGGRRPFKWTRTCKVNWTLQAGRPNPGRLCNNNGNSAAQTDQTPEFSLAGCDYRKLFLSRRPSSGLYQVVDAAQDFTTASQLNGRKRPKRAAQRPSGRESKVAKIRIVFCLWFGAPAASGSPGRPNETTPSSLARRDCDTKMMNRPSERYEPTKCSYCWRRRRRHHHHHQRWPSFVLSSLRAHDNKTRTTVAASGAAILATVWSDFKLSFAIQERAKQTTTTTTTTTTATTLDGHPKPDKVGGGSQKLSHQKRPKFNRQNDGHVRGSSDVRAPPATFALMNLAGKLVEFACGCFAKLAKLGCHHPGPGRRRPLASPQGRTSRRNNNNNNNKWTRRFPYTIMTIMIIVADVVCSPSWSSSSSAGSPQDFRLAAASPLGPHRQYLLTIKQQEGADDKEAAMKLINYGPWMANSGWIGPSGCSGLAEGDSVGQQQQVVGATQKYCSVDVWTDELDPKTRCWLCATQTGKFCSKLGAPKRIRLINFKCNLI